MGRENIKELTECHPLPGAVARTPSSQTLSGGLRLSLLTKNKLRPNFFMLQRIKVSQYPETQELRFTCIRDVDPPAL
jgi:hypothetical protein